MGNQKKHNSKKVGRESREPSHVRYTAERRWLIHKRDNILRMMHRHKNYSIPDSCGTELRELVDRARLLHAD